MRPRPLSEIAAVLGCPGQAPASPVLVTGVSTDSRQLRPGDLFVALKGDRFDGADFVPEALRAGAIAALSSRPAGGAVIVVPDPLLALERLAAAARSEFQGTVVGITGSAGKTTTKECLRAILAVRFRVHASEKSFNNRIGVSKTLLDADPAGDVLVVEIGTSAKGEIRSLAALARPTLGLITNIGPAHLKGLHTVEGVLEEKLDLFRALPRGSKALLSGDDPLLLRADVDPGLVRRTYGFHSGAAVRGVDLAVTDRGVAFRLEGGSVDIAAPLAGRHNASNLLGAAAVALELGLSDAEIREGAARVEAPPLRMEERERNGARLVLDCYNANPLSVAAALDDFDRRSAAGRKVFVFGDMLELGDEATFRHVDVGRRVASGTADLFVCCGPLAALARDAAVRAGFDPKRTILLEDSAASAGMPEPQPGDLFFFKASRGVAMERLLSDPAPARQEQPTVELKVLNVATTKGRRGRARTAGQAPSGVAERGEG